jgi:hypothetical protein
MDRIRTTPNPQLRYQKPRILTTSENCNNARWLTSKPEIKQKSKAKHQSK